MLDEVRRLPSKKKITLKVIKWIYYLNGQDGRIMEIRTSDFIQNIGAVYSQTFPNWLKSFLFEEVSPEEYQSIRGSKKYKINQENLDLLIQAHNTPIKSFEKI